MQYIIQTTLQFYKHIVQLRAKFVKMTNHTAQFHAFVLQTKHLFKTAFFII